LIFSLQASCLAVAAHEDVIAKASALLRAGKAKQGETLLRSASEADPDSAELHGALGKVLFKQEKYEDAVRELGLAVEAEPDSREYNMLLSEALMGWRHFQVAVDFLHAVQPHFAQYPEFHYDLGFAYYNLNRMNEAKAEFEEALRLAPNFERAEFLLASCIAAQGDTARAVEIFRKLVREHPSNEADWVTLGEMLGDMGDQSRVEALRACRRALALKPGDPHAEYVKAVILLKNRDFADARPLFERLEKLGPKSLEVHVALARIYGRLGDRERARKEAEAASELQSKQTEILSEWQKRKAAALDQPTQHGEQSGGSEGH